ncbi:unnamed protein product [Brachionus calyciflorus]|uniref:Uncharacterized protein n=1 Tax=Brachionus calyciflorus TaxID=104777 RepID=A0A813NDD8_9BILA|nr:unnamed protein product [Brachionus calyciflorus]
MAKKYSFNLPLKTTDESCTEKKASKNNQPASIMETSLFKINRQSTSSISVSKLPDLPSFSQSLFQEFSKQKT